MRKKRAILEQKRRLVEIEVETLLCGAKSLKGVCGSEELQKLLENNFTRVDL